MAPRYSALILSGHAKERRDVQGRSYITKELLEEVLRDPTNEMPNKKPDRRTFWKAIAGKTYVVVIKEKKGGKAVVITAYRRD